MSIKAHTGLGPLQDGSTAIVVGGGPGGVGCAVAMIRLAATLGRRIKVVLYEAKHFSGHVNYNQCLGVLSPPFEFILEHQLGIPFPHHIIQRRIDGYILHTAGRSIVLDDAGEPAYAVRRVEIDDYLLQQARLQGVEVVQSRVTDIEFHPDRVMVFSDSDSRQADVVIGAFGLDDGATKMMAGVSPYRPPQFLSALVTKFHPDAEAMAAFGARIHAFLPSDPRIEFGAITPKGNHVVVNVAGRNMNVGVMEDFLASEIVRGSLPAYPAGLGSTSDCHEYHKGRFPISVASGFYGDRYVLVGDAAGLVRAFKGKGINSACLTGLWAADVILTQGISRSAFARYYTRSCHAILSDLPYGRAIRHLVGVGRRLGWIDIVISIAEAEPAVREALLGAVSGNLPYRDIVVSLSDAHLIMRSLLALLRSRRSRAQAHS